MKLARSQKGFTLIEVLAATAISGLLLAVAVSITFQTTNVTMHSSADITAFEDIKRVAHPIVPDLRMAQETDLQDGADPVDHLALDWTSWYDDEGELSPVDYHCEYALVAGENKVERKYWADYDDQSPGDPTSTSSIGKYISGIEFSREGYLVKVVISSSPEDRPETEEHLTYQLSMREMEDPVQ
jgi:prepilin-type N-terminal cleavage/methylation domain-containing protein